jgi:hypothetical protein
MESAMNGSGVEEVVEAVARISLLPKRRDSGLAFDRGDKRKTARRGLSIKRSPLAMRGGEGEEKCAIM